MLGSSVLSNLQYGANAKNFRLHFITLFQIMQVLFFLEDGFYLLL